MAKKFAVFDIDGTLIRWQLYHAIADAFVELGFARPEAYSAVRSARMNWKQRAEGASFRNYEIELIKTYEQVLAQITTDQFEQAARRVFEEYKDQVYVYTRELIAKLKREGYLLFAISGSQTEIVEMIAKHYGFDDFVGTVYERAGQKFTGKSIVASHNKASALKELVEKHAASFRHSVAVGDSKSDAEMMELVEKPIAFNPDADLYKIARTRAWSIVLERKSVIYEMECKNGRYELVQTNAG